MSNWWKIIHSTPHAISQYKSQAKRAQKAAGLTVIKISDNHWKVGKWDVTGEAKSCISSNNSLQCNCPDRTSEEPPRSWVGSGAGGFNPCKHVYAVLLKEEGNLSKKRIKIILRNEEILIFDDTPIIITCTASPGNRNLKIYGSSNNLLAERNFGSLLTCAIIFTYDEIGVPGSLTSGDNRFGVTYSIGVPNGDFVGEWIPDGSGFSPCPSITQYIVRARNPQTGQIIGQIRSTTCHDLQLQGWINTCICDNTPCDYGGSLNDCLPCCVTSIECIG